MEILFLAALVLAGSLLEAFVAFFFAFFTPKDEQSELSENLMSRYDALTSDAKSPII